MEKNGEFEIFLKEGNGHVTLNVNKIGCFFYRNIELNCIFFWKNETFLISLKS